MSLFSQVQKVIKRIVFFQLLTYYSHYQNNEIILEEQETINKSKIHTPITLSQPLLTGWVQFNP